MTPVTGTNERNPFLKNVTLPLKQKVPSLSYPFGSKGLGELLTQDEKLFDTTSILTHYLKDLDEQYGKRNQVEIQSQIQSILEKTADFSLRKELFGRLLQAKYASFAKAFFKHEAFKQQIASDQDIGELLTTARTNMLKNNKWGYVLLNILRIYQEEAVFENFIFDQSDLEKLLKSIPYSFFYEEEKNRLIDLIRQRVSPKESEKGNCFFSDQKTRMGSPKSGAILSTRNMEEEEKHFSDQKNRDRPNQAPFYPPMERKERYLGARWSPLTQKISYLRWKRISEMAVPLNYPLIPSSQINEGSLPPLKERFHLRNQLLIFPSQINEGALPPLKKRA